MRADGGLKVDMILKTDVFFFSLNAFHSVFLVRDRALSLESEPRLRRQPAGHRVRYPLTTRRDDKNFDGEPPVLSVRRGLATRRRAG